MNLSHSSLDHNLFLDPTKMVSNKNLDSADSFKSPPLPFPQKLNN